MKKALILALVLLFGITSTAFAFQNLDISVTDVTNDVVTVKGIADSNDLPVSLVILNPGYTKESLSDGSYEAQTKAIQTFKATYPINGEYTFEVPMKDTTSQEEGGGIYTVYITVGSNEFNPVAYKFYFQNVKNGVIQTINNSAELMEEDVKDAYVKYGLEEYELFAGGNISKIAEALELLKAEETSGKFSEDTAVFDVVLKKAALIAGFNASKDSILVKDGYLYYPELMGIDSTIQWHDYGTLLSEDGVKGFNEDLIKISYESIEDIQDKFLELIAYYGILGYKEAGFGHFDYFFEQYEDTYKDYGFKFSKVKSSTRNKVYKDLLNSDADNLSELADDFNDIAKKYAEEGGSSGSSSGGGGRGSVGSGIPVVPETSVEEYITPEISFDDLAQAEWARSAVMYLAEKGVVSGKAKNVFAPNDIVTRGEFLKMLTMAVGVPQTGAQTAFTDIEDHWAKNYIAAAVNAGIAAGVSETEFAPNMTITREMGAAFALRAFNYKNFPCDKDAAEFSDHNEISPFAVDAVYVLKNAAIMSGVGDNMFNPKGSMTRAEAARMIYSIMIYAEEVGK